MKHTALTTEEKAILPHLAACSTQDEITQLLKLQTRQNTEFAQNMLDKLPENSFEDGLLAIRSYAMEHADPNILDYLYCKKCVANVIYDTDALTLRSKVTSTFLNMMTETTSLQSTTTNCHFETVSVRINGEIGNHVFSRGKTDVYEATYDPPIPAFTTFIRTTDVLRSVVNDPFKDHEYWINICYPTRFLDVRVKFTGRRVPNIVFGQAKSSDAVYFDRIETFDSSSQHSFRITANLPLIGHHYGIVWKW